MHICMSDVLRFPFAVLQQAEVEKWKKNPQDHRCVSLLKYKHQISGLLVLSSKYKSNSVRSQAFFSNNRRGYKYIHMYVYVLKNKVRGQKKIPLNRRQCHIERTRYFIAGGVVKNQCSNGLMKIPFSFFRFYYFHYNQPTGLYNIIRLNGILRKGNHFLFSYKKVQSRWPGGWWCNGMWLVRWNLRFRPRGVPLRQPG